MFLLIDRTTPPGLSYYLQVFSFSFSLFAAACCLLLAQCKLSFLSVYCFVACGGAAKTKKRRAVGGLVTTRNETRRAGCSTNVSPPSINTIRPWPREKERKISALDAVARCRSGTKLKDLCLLTDDCYVRRSDARDRDTYCTYTQVDYFFVTAESDGGLDQKFLVSIFFFRCPLFFYSTRHHGIFFKECDCLLMMFSLSILFRLMMFPITRSCWCRSSFFSSNVEEGTTTRANANRGCCCFIYIIC